MSADQSALSSHQHIIQAGYEHQLDITNFLNGDNLTYSHYDWLRPLDWLGQQPFLFETVKNEIQAILLTAPEVSSATWVRLFSTKFMHSYYEIWQRLLKTTILMLKSQQITRIGALGVSEWLTGLLQKSAFVEQNQIVVLECNSQLPPRILLNPQVKIRPMCDHDLPTIEDIDHLAFSPLWQNSLKALTKGYHLSEISTVAILHDQIVGFQISTASTIHGHLARLAVHPDFQRQHVATALMYNLFGQMKAKGVWQITVNTQADNQPSLNIYHAFGFEKTREIIPVFIREIV